MRWELPASDSNIFQSLEGASAYIAWFVSIEVNACVGISNISEWRTGFRTCANLDS